jgi:heat shock protein HtpX
MNINTLKTILLLSSLSGLFLFVGYLFGGTSGMTIAFILSLAMNAYAYFFSDKIVLRMYGAQPLDKHTYGWIYDDVAELAAQMNIPMPKLWLINTPMANAFATGRSPEHASVAVTTGILDILNKKELRGVLAHELSHVQNRDILVTTIAATIASALGYIATMMRFGAYRSDDKQRTNPLFILLASVLMPIAATIIQMAISRSREFLADDTGAHACKDPLALASALEKLHNHIPDAHLNANDTQRASTAPLFIVHPFDSKNWSALFSTHPPIGQRIARLREINKILFK